MQLQLILALLISTLLIHYIQHYFYTPYQTIPIDGLKMSYTRINFYHK